MAASDVSEPELLSRLEGGDILLMGCGKMGGAILDGWLAAGVPGARLRVVEPAPVERLRVRAAENGVTLTAELAPAPAPPAAALIAIKPQGMAAAAGALATLGGGATLLVSVAAGTPIAWFEATCGAGTPIVRAMPNTPAAVGKGVTALIGNTAAAGPRLDLAEAMMRVVGATVRLEDEAQIDVVTALSGAGPAYVFHLIEALAEAGAAEGLAPDLAMRLARETVIGAGALAAAADESAAELRTNVTSPNGVTAAGLGRLMAEGEGLASLMRRTVAAATVRSRELGR